MWKKSKSYESRGKMFSTTKNSYRYKLSSYYIVNCRIYSYVIFLSKISVEEKMRWLESLKSLSMNMLLNKTNSRKE